MIDEAALRRDVGGPEVMRHQIRHLAEAATLPNVTVQALPFSAGAHRGMRGAITALRFPDEPMNTVYLEMYDAALYVEAPAQVAKFTDVLKQLAHQAKDASDTTRLLEQIVEELS